MMGDTDYRSVIKNAIDSIGRELEIEIDANNYKTIHLLEVIQCLRRSYYDRTDSKEIERRGSMIFLVDYFGNWSMAVNQKNLQLMI